MVAASFVATFATGFFDGAAFAATLAGTFFFSLAAAAPFAVFAVAPCLEATFCLLAIFLLLLIVFPLFSCWNPYLYK